MKKIVLLFVSLIVLTMTVSAGSGKGPNGIYLSINGQETHYRLNSETWWGNTLADAISRCPELNNVEIGTIKSLRLVGGEMTAWQNETSYHDATSFRLYYRVYKQGESAGEWNIMALDEEGGTNGNDIKYVAQNKNIDLRALTDERGGTWVLEAKINRKVYWNGGTDSRDNAGSVYTATFYLPEHYYVAGNGSGNWCGGSEYAWSCNYSENEIVNGSKTFLNVASGDYMFKVTNGYWNNEDNGILCNEYFYDDLDVENSYPCTKGENDNKDNICFSLSLPSDVHILFDNGKIRLVVTPVYFVTSNKNSWATNNESHRLDPATNSITYNNMSAGNFHFRILNGKWPVNGGTVWNYDDMDYDNSTFGYYETGDQNINIELEESADVTIHLNPETNKISVTSSLGYYSTIPYSIVGDKTLTGHDWKADIVATEMADQGNGTYQYTQADKFLSAGTYGYKVLANHRWDAGCVYPVGHGNNAQVSIEEDGTYTLTYTFAPATKTLTCEAVRQTNDVTISAYGYSTFYSDKAFELPSGLKAMIFTGVEGDQLTAEELTTIPANTGVVLQGTANATYTLMQTETDATYSTNLLKGTLEDETIDNGYVHYILGIYNEQCGLFWPYGTSNGKGSFTNKAGKAYLELGGATPAPAHVRGFVLTGTSVATGVEDVSVQPEGAYYDLLGRQVREPQPGQMYIQNGKKIVW